MRIESHHDRLSRQAPMRPSTLKVVTSAEIFGRSPLSQDDWFPPTTAAIVSAVRSLVQDSPSCAGRQLREGHPTEWEELPKGYVTGASASLARSHERTARPPGRTSPRDRVSGCR